MFYDRGPHSSAKCPFYILPNTPLSAEKSIKQCVRKQTMCLVIISMLLIVGVIFGLSGAFNFVEGAYVVVLTLVVLLLKLKKWFD